MSALPAGPTESAAVQTARWMARPISFLESCRRRYGDAFTVNFTGFERPMVVVSHPEVIRALYTERDNGLPAGRTVSLLPLVGPHSVLLVEGAEHLARRRLMLPPFHGERMGTYESIVRDLAERDAERWPVGRPFALHPHMQSVTFDVILHAVFGVTDPARADALRDRLPRLMAAVTPALQIRVMLASRIGRGDPLVRLREMAAGIDELLLAEIQERRAGMVTEREERARTDILSLLVAARFEDGSEMSDADLRDQLMTLLLAGHETTASGLAWTFELLLRHPAVLERLVEELHGGDPAYVRAVVSEALRLRPVVPLAGRRLAHALDAGGLHLPVGTDVTPAIWLTHTRADLYPEPLAFRPERFLEQPTTTYGWIPFGGGIRRCLGAAFAEMEMRVVLDTVLRRWRLQAADPRAERPQRRGPTFAPRRGTRVLAWPASPSAAAAPREAAAVG